jgi:hypothetical protein
MTAYFDEMHKRIHELDGNAARAWELFGIVENDLVRDVSVASEFPDFPEDLRLRINQLVLKHCVQALPVNAPPADFAEMSTYTDRLQRLCWDLHTVFHDLVYRAAEDETLRAWFSDDPRQPLRVLLCRSEERREQLVPSASQP